MEMLGGEVDFSVGQRYDGLDWSYSIVKNMFVKVETKEYCFLYC